MPDLTLISSISRRTCVLTQEVTQLRNVSVYWGTEDGLAPPDTPPCGFLGEFCPDKPTEQECSLLFLSVLLYFVDFGINILVLFFVGLVFN